MEAKEFQRKALDRLDLYLGKLLEAQARCARQAQLRDENPDAGIVVGDFPVLAWEAMANASEVGRAEPYSTRRDGIGSPVPCITLKVPTGGGKTFLAVHSLAKVLENYFADSSEKFVLWIVPSEAIYRQTKEKLIDREHAFRKLLDIASGGRVKILEKDSPLHRDDLKGGLCVMMLMLPSANRQDAVDKLKMFRDRGSVNGFFPEDDDLLAHQALRELVPNLDYVGVQDLFAEGGDVVGQIRSSLGNALRMVRPLIVLDEGHKAFSDLAHKTLYGFNPRFVLELSATPKDGVTRRANWLVNIGGMELDREEMIKMPMLVTVTPENSWQACLREAWQQTVSLQADADTLDANEQTYIRPILLVQAERTGDDQRVEGVVHSADAREYLVRLGVSEDAIAIKTSSQDDLKVMEVKDLLDRACPIRVIITKQALQEGWDCPFAYVLCSLAKSRSANAMTQLVGRILRQPYVKRTGVPALDQCYVYTYHASVKEVVDQVKAGLESEGMADVAGQVLDSSATVVDRVKRDRRDPFKGKKYYLPQVLAFEGDGKARDLDWEVDILGRIDWQTLRLKVSTEGLARGAAEMRGGVRAVDISVVLGAEAKLIGPGVSAASFDPVFAVRSLMDHVPNPWIAQEWVDRYLESLRSAGWTNKELGEHQQYVIGSLVTAAGRLIDEAAQEAFDDGLGAGRIAFHLVAEKWWPKWEVPDVSIIDIAAGARIVRRPDDTDLERDLFPRTYQSELNGLELKVAYFLDRQQAVTWWYRNLVRGAAYGLQGWRRNRIYPDFIIAQEADGQLERWLVIETKGDQLAGNLDTMYKRELMNKLSDVYAAPPANLGQLTLFENKAKYECRLVAEESWEAGVRGLLSGHVAAVNGAE